MADHNNCVLKLYLFLLSSIEKPCNQRFIYTIFLASNSNISVIPREYNVRVQGIVSWFAKQLYVNKHPIFVTYLKKPKQLVTSNDHPIANFIYISKTSSRMYLQLFLSL